MRDYEIVGGKRSIFKVTPRNWQETAVIVRRVHAGARSVGCIFQRRCLNNQLPKPRPIRYIRASNGF